MKLCFFSAQYLPTPGGVERYTWNLARRAVAAGHKVLVVTSALPGLPAHETDADGIEIMRLPVWPVMKGRFPVLRPGTAFAAASRAVWAWGPEFCVIQTRMYTQSVWAARGAAQRGIPALVLDHSTGYMMHGGAAGLAGRWYEHLACGIIRRCGFPFYGVSADVCRWLQTFGIKAVGQLPNAVDPAELAALANDPHTMDWRARMQLHPGQKLVAFVGRLIPEKGAGALIEAVRGQQDLALVVAGTGPEFDRLRQTAPGNVVCAGALPHHEIIALLCQADCYCLPTTYAEGFPTTLLEAAACHCPLVCTATAGTAELMPGPDYGVLLPDAAPETIRTALQTLLADPARCRRCADAAYKNLCAHFTWDAVFAKMIAIAQQSCGTPQQKEPKCPNS